MSAIVSNATEAWCRYVSIGAITPALLRPHVFESWVRSHDQGASAWVARPEELSPGATCRLLERHARLCAAARPYMHLLSEAASGERHVAVLGSAEALVLEVVGDERSVSGPERVPGPGALLSEAVCGANGLGTAVASRRYVELVSTEHFIHGFHPYTCYGIPLESPTGELDGVLAVSVRRPATSEGMRETLFCAAHGIVGEIARLALLDRVRAVVDAGQPDRAAIEALRRDLARLGVPTTHPSAGGVDEVSNMMTLLGAAEGAVERFEREGRTWHELATVGLAVASPMELTREVAELVALLGPECRRRRVECRVRDDVGDGVLALADRHLLRRSVFRLLLRALDGADSGGAVSIDVSARQAERSCSLSVRSMPAPDSARPSSSSSMSWPLLRVG